MLAYWVYDRYRNENDVETFGDMDNYDGGSQFSPKSSLFRRNQNAVQPLSPIYSKEQHPRYMIDDDADLSMSDYGNGDDDDDDLSSDDVVSSSDYDEYFDAKDREVDDDGITIGDSGSRDKEQVPLVNGTSVSEDHKEDLENGVSYEDNMHFFPTESEFVDSPPSARRRQKKNMFNQDGRSSFYSSWNNRSSGSFRGLVDLGSCLSKQGYDGTYIHLFFLFKTSSVFCFS